jgi:hypothetical protein
VRIREEGIEMKRIPVENYVQLRDGFSLEIISLLEVLAHFRDNNNMSEAIEQILPKYAKISQSEIDKQDEEIVKKLFYRKLMDKHKNRKRYMS